MSIGEKLRALYGTLGDLMEALELSPIEESFEIEQIEKVVWTGSVRLSVLQPIAEGRSFLERFFDIFGKALYLRVELDDSVVDSDDPHCPPKRDWIPRVSNLDLEQLSGLIEYAGEYVDKIKLYLEIDKSVLLRRLGPRCESSGQRGRVRCLLFFFGSRLREILPQKQDFLDFERGFLLGPAERATDRPQDRRLLVLIADGTGKIVNQQLAVLGWDHAVEAVAFLDREPDFKSQQAQREILDKECKWIDGPRLLTPGFFDLESADPTDPTDGSSPPSLDSLREVFEGYRDRLAAGYLAERTERSVGQWLATFAGKREVSIRLDAGAGSRQIFELYRWAYREIEMVHTKLQIVRRVLPGLLPLETSGFDALAEVATAALRNCAIQLRILIDKNIAESFEWRRNFDQKVRSHLDDMGAGIRGVSKEVVVFVFKAAGLLVGVGIAYLLEPDEAPLLIALAALLYAVYILIVRFFYLASIREDFESRDESFRRERDEIESSGLVDPEALANRFAEVGNRRRDFDRKFITASGIYLLFVVIAATISTGILSFGVFNSPGAQRQRALKVQIERFEDFGYRDVRAAVENRTPPDRIAGPTAGRRLLPDLTALRGDGSLLVLEYLPCSDLGGARERVRLVQLERFVVEERADFHLLTDAVCGERPGSVAVAEWLDELGIDGALIWTF